MRLQRSVNRALQLLCVTLLACEPGSPGGANPVEPPLSADSPTIVSIEPAGAEPGDRVTIRGTHLGGDDVAVSFDGTRSEILWGTATAVLALVPDVPAGDRAVIVSTGGRSSSPFRYRVSPRILPTILRIEPSSALYANRCNIRISDVPLPIG